MKTVSRGEALKALDEGRKIRHITWDCDGYYVLKDSVLYEESGKLAKLGLIPYDGWIILEDDPRTLKSIEELFAGDVEVVKITFPDRSYIQLDNYPEVKWGIEEYAAVSCALRDGFPVEVVTE